MNYAVGLVLMLVTSPAFAGQWLAGGLPLANPECAVLLTDGYTVGQLQSMLGRLGLNEGHRLVLDGSRGLPVRREWVSAGSNQPSPIVIERLVPHPNMPPFPMLRLEPVDTGSVTLDLVMQTERASLASRPFLSRSSYEQDAAAQDAYLRDLSRALLNGDVSEFLRDAVPLFRLSLRVALPEDAIEFMRTKGRVLRFSPATRIEIMRRMGVFEATHRVGQRKEYEGATVREQINGLEFYPRHATYDFYPKLVLPRRAEGSAVIANILFYSALHRHLLSHYPEALGVSPDVKVSPEPAALTMAGERPGRIAAALKRSPPPPGLDEKQLQFEYDASIVRFGDVPVKRFHVDTELGPFTLDGFQN